ncbi:MAG: hypothetical protein ACI9R3_001871 [Verrucomicrobiales bacterium]|jgi:hypothetical protein
MPREVGTVEPKIRVRSELNCRSIKHAAICGKFFTTAALVLFLFPEVATYSSVCARCGTAVTYTREVSPMNRKKRFFEVQNNPIRCEVDHTHEFSDPQVGDY